jgi:hypothetical protein
MLTIPQKIVLGRIFPDDIIGEIDKFIINQDFDIDHPLRIVECVKDATEKNKKQKLDEKKKLKDNAFQEIEYILRDMSAQTKTKYTVTIQDNYTEKLNYYFHYLAENDLLNEVGINVRAEEDPDDGGEIVLYLIIFLYDNNGFFFKNE